MSTSVADSSNNDNLKRLFLKVAYNICPSFTVTDYNRQQIADIFKWCTMQPDGRYNPHKGLWIWGNIGTGKSTMLAIIKDFCRRVRPVADGWPYSFKIVHSTEICSEFARDGYDPLNKYIESRRLAIDELGSETIPTGHYGMNENVLRYLLQLRYDRRWNGFTHVTTNLTTREIVDAYGARIFDRCKEIFNFVEFSGPTFRK